MLIKIDYSLVNDSENENIWSEETIIALENLATARREGKHAIVSDRKTLEKIVNCPDLGKITKSIYQKLLNDVSTHNFNSYLRFVSLYVEVISNCPEPYISDSSGKKIIKVSPKFFNFYFFLFLVSPKLAMY